MRVRALSYTLANFGWPMRSLALELGFFWLQDRFAFTSRLEADRNAAVAERDRVQGELDRWEHHHEDEMRRLTEALAEGAQPRPLTIICCSCAQDAAPVSRARVDPGIRSAPRTGAIIGSVGQARDKTGEMSYKLRSRRVSKISERFLDRSSNSPI